MINIIYFYFFNILIKKFSPKINLKITVPTVSKHRSLFFIKIYREKIKAPLSPTFFDLKSSYTFTPTYCHITSFWTKLASVSTHIYTFSILIITWVEMIHQSTFVTLLQFFFFYNVVTFLNNNLISSYFSHLYRSSFYIMK